VSNIVLGGTNCGWLELPGSNFYPNANTTLDVIFTLNVGADPSHDYGIVGGSAPSLNVIINGGNSFRRMDIDFGSTKSFYIQGGTGLVPGTTYHLVVENDNTKERVWLNGTAMTTNAAGTRASDGSNLYANAPLSGTNAMNRIGNFYNTGSGYAFPGSISYIKLDSQLAYLTSLETITVTNTLSSNANTKFLMSPSTVVPSYAMVSSFAYSNPTVTFQGANNFAVGETISVTAPSATGYNKTGILVTASTSSSFSANYGASSPGSATGYAYAMTTGVLKDDTGALAIQWKDGICSSPSAAPLLLSSLAISIGLLGGGNSAIYRTATTIQAPVTIPGKITFYQQGKAIPGCKALTFAAVGTASCIWRPAQHTTVALTAQLTPTSGGYTPPLVSMKVNVITRTSNR
jgi:hypothetical protein